MHKISIPEFAVARGAAFNPVRLIDPKRTAVIAIDFQRFFIDDGHPMGNLHARDILANANRLNAAVRHAGGLVVFTQASMALPPDDPAYNPENDSEAIGNVLVPGSPSFDIHPDIERTTADLTLVKYRSSPLHPLAGTGLLQLLRDRGIQTLIVTGLASNGCCDCMARDAFQHGFNVVFATDSSAAMTDEEHNATLLNLTLYYARVISTDEIITELE